MPQPEGGIDMLKRSLNQAFDQYVIDRVDTILSIAGITDEKYSKTVKEAHTVLEQLLKMAKGLEAQHPELLRMVMDFEAATAVEAGFAAEIAYKEGLRDISYIRQEFMSFLQKSPCQ